MYKAILNWMTYKPVTREEQIKATNEDVVLFIVSIGVLAVFFCVTMAVKYS